LRLHQVLKLQAKPARARLSAPRTQCRGPFSPILGKRHASCDRTQPSASSSCYQVPRL